MMNEAARGEKAQLIREEARIRYVDPARRRGEITVQIIVGELLKDLRQGGDRAPAVCSALKTKEFLQRNNLILERVEGPPKKQSTTVKFTYRLLGVGPAGNTPAEDDAFLRLRGIGKDIFQSLGGGEAYIRRERERFYEPDPGPHQEK